MEKPCPFDIEFARDAVKALRHMQPATAQDIREGIAKAADDPFAPNNNLRARKGVTDGFRIRVGDWRVSYTLDRGARRIRIFEIAPRGGAYR